MFSWEKYSTKKILCIYVWLFLIIKYKIYCVDRLFFLADRTDVPVVDPTGDSQKTDAQPSE